MKRVSTGKYELTAGEHYYEVMRRDVPITEWFAFKDKAALGSFPTYRDARATVHADVDNTLPELSSAPSSIEESVEGQVDGGGEVIEIPTVEVISEEDSSVGEENEEERYNPFSRTLD